MNYSMPSQAPLTPPPSAGHSDPHGSLSWNILEKGINLQTTVIMEARRDN